MFFFPETYALRDIMIQRYPHLRFVNRGTTLTPEQQAILHGPELWKRNPDLCCKIRKVDPMAEVMKDVDVWITGLRRDQSKTRAGIRVLEWDWKYKVMKFNPMVGWTRQDIWSYVQAHDVPYNTLHEQGYPTIGCTHCTSPVAGSTLGEYSRAGRWAGTEKKECGLHGDGI
jgi:phosphoadenosine phosphosulfate reductase